MSIQIELIQQLVHIIIKKVGKLTEKLVIKLAPYTKSNLGTFLTSMVTILLLFPLLYVISLIPYTEYFYSLVLLFGYPILLHYLYKSMKTIKEEELAIIITLFLFMSLNLIVWYGLIAFKYDLLKATDGSIVAGFDYLYWTSTTFTTLGYGDYLPKEVAGKFVSMALSLTGTIHMVSFLAILLNKLNKSVDS